MKNSDPSGLSRRDFLVSTIAAGFALAVRPICAQTLVMTDSAGMVADTVRIPAEGAMLPAYVAHPAADGQWPVLLVVQEIFGVHEHIRDVCRRLAKLGFLAIAPELFFRQGDVSGLKDVGEIVSSVVSKVPDAQVMADLDATVAWAERSGMTEPGKLGITGFCWGGRIVWLYAAHNPGLSAGVAWYGRLEGGKTALQPAHPLDMAAGIKAPVLGLYGGADQGIPQDSVDRMRAALALRNNGSDIVVFPDAPHAFFADYRPAIARTPHRRAGGACCPGSRCMDCSFRKHGPLHRADTPSAIFRTVCPTSISDIASGWYYVCCPTETFSTIP